MRETLFSNVATMRSCAVFVCAFMLLFAPVAFATAASVENPLKFDSIAKFVEGALQALVVIALPIIALFIVYSGFLFVFARGNADKINTAKENFLWVIVGAVLILAAYALSQLLQGTVQQLRT